MTVLARGQSFEERVPRRRRAAPRWARPLLRPFFRFSFARNAWVLRGIGSYRGPVFREL